MKLNQLVNSYRKSNGTVVFTYTIAGSQAEIDAYKAKQGAQFRSDDKGNALFFSINEHPVDTELGISQKTGNYFAKTKLLEGPVADRVTTLKALAAYTGYTPGQMVQAALTGFAAPAQPEPVAVVPAP